VSDYGLVCPFLTNDPAFAHGVEFGMVYARLRDGREDAIEDYFTTANQEQITLAANRLGWRVAGMRRRGGGWFWCRLERPGADRAQPASSGMIS
jgi:hypothetical protein